MGKQLTFSLLMITALVIVGTTFYAAASLQYRTQEVASNYGAIRGRVLDADGKPVSQARVSASRLVSGLLPSTRTDDQGNFFIGGLKPGTYTINLMCDSF